MNDDEEFSYTSYSADTEAEINRQAFKDNEEVFTYTGYAEENSAEEVAVSEEAVEEESHPYGDFLVEEFSAENNVQRLAKLTKLPANTAVYFVAAIYLVIGVLCVSITHYITEYLPYIVGGMMVLIGVIQFIVAMVQREYRTVKTNRTAGSLIIVALGAMILFQKIDPENDPIMLISVAWGILGLFEAAHAFNHAFKRIANSERCIYYLIKGIIECAVAFLLLYQPESEAAHEFHIIVLGANLIFDSITMIPKIQELLSMK